MTASDQLSAATAAGCLVDLQTLTDPLEVARFAVDHLQSATGARWAEVVQADHATGGLITLAATDGGLTQELQHCRSIAGEPPAPGSPDLAPTITFDDLRAESPWPAFAAAAASRTPVRSAVLTYVATHDTATVVPVYDDRPGFFTPPRRQYAELVARLVGLVLARLAVLEELEHLRVAATSRQQVGTAVGILSARRGVSAEAAFALLRTASSHSNRKLRDIAAEVIRDGRLPPA